MSLPFTLPMDGRRLLKNAFPASEENRWSRTAGRLKYTIEDEVDRIVGIREEGDRDFELSSQGGTDRAIRGTWSFTTRITSRLLAGISPTGKARLPGYCYRPSTQCTKTHMSP